MLYAELIFDYNRLTSTSADERVLGGVEDEKPFYRNEKLVKHYITFE